ncbi:hypothetical protein AAFF_G00426160 [Aldrovandia affinis]|uniref:Gypsy retrotransposon integrase-like protein 1 n=1 Tax=Aldrovandia affinis TaxID=143900 RepID=A0AAD7T746_9TELE|nr:hypothetical protein AAFF_G00426160 [Aldrovandia affinis]
MKNNCLVDAQTFTSFACTRGEAVYSGLSSLLSEEDQYLRLLAEFPDLTQPTFSAPTVKHGVEHHIDTKGCSTPPSWPSLKRSSRTWSSQHGLIVNPAKCLFGRAPSNSLDTASRVRGCPLPSKVEAVAAFPRPLTARSLREFIGMVTFYHRFIPRAAHTLRPLYEALKGKSPNQAIEWTAEREGAFKDTKAALAQAAMLAHPSHTAPIAITTDASDYAVGAVYEQWVGGAWQPLAFFSRQLSPSERKYSTFDRELLGLWLAIRHFRFLLEGREFTAYVDHKPLTFAMSKVAEPWSARQQRQFSLSRSSPRTSSTWLVSPTWLRTASPERWSGGPAGLDYSHMATDQASDPTVQTLKTMDTGLRLEEVAFGDTGATLLCDISTGQPRPVVPVSWRRPVFEAVHGLSHPGRKPSVRLVAAKFVWHGLRKDVKAWVDTCTACQRAKVHRHIKAPLERFSIPERRFDHVNVDLVGPLPPSHGYTYLFTMVDRTTRWPEAVPSPQRRPRTWPGIHRDVGRPVRHSV